MSTCRQTDKQRITCLAIRDTYSLQKVASWNQLPPRMPLLSAPWPKRQHCRIKVKVMWACVQSRELESRLRSLAADRESTMRQNPTFVTTAETCCSTGLHKAVFGVQRAKYSRHTRVTWSDSSLQNAARLALHRWLRIRRHLSSRLFQT